MYVVSEAVAQALVTMADAIEVIDEVFRALHAGTAEVFPVVAGHGSDPGNGFAIKSGLIRSKRLPGMKVGTYWPSNRTRGLASHGSTTVLLDDATGTVRAIVAATHLTALRTAAADGVAVRKLARKDARSVAIIGAGHQAWYDLLAVCAVRQIESVYVWSRMSETASQFAERVQQQLKLACEALPIDRAVRQADIVVTATASRQALVMNEWVRPGTHVSAMGADAPGKQELDVELIARATCFADVPAQSTSIGELQSAVRAGVLRPELIRPLGAVLCEALAGRGSEDEITVFDSSGMALQDLAIAEFALAAALRSGAAVEVDF
jgi:ornithine cyclodeaminase